MNSFGLGLVLSFVDSASAGINTATSNFNRMSATADSLTSSVNASATEMAAIAYSLGAVGDTFVSIGESITSVFTGITEQVISTGGEMLNYRMQLSALYGSVEAGEDKMEDIKKFAMSSVFEIQSLIPAVTMMKAVGIEALDSVTTSSGNATQKLIEYASDLAAMIPNMRNVYGTGVEAAMGAFKEYIAEGNAMSLKRGAGLDIEGILGEDKGSSIAERTQQVADLIEKLGIVGYTANLAGTPTQRLSNLQDALFNSLSKIADSGVFESYCTLLETLSDGVFRLVEDEESFNTITGILAETITTLLSPLQSMLDWVVENVDVIVTWINEHPKLTKNILLTVAAIGAFLVVGGSLLKLLSSIAFATTGLGVLKTLPMLLGKLVIAMLPFIAIAGIAYTIWNKNLLGIRDTVVQVFKDLGTLLSIVFDAWGDNSLSEENFQKAKELGILPFIESILDLKYLFTQFTEGFSIGFQKVFDTIDRLVGKIAPVNNAVFSLANRIGTFLKSVFNVKTNSESWGKVGEVFGKIAGALTVAIPLIMTAVKAFGLIKGAISLVTNPVGLVVLAIAAVVAAIAGLKYAWDNNLGGIQEKTRAVLENILGFYNTYLAPFVARVVNFVGTIITIVRNLWETWLKPIFTQIGDFLSGLWTNSIQPLLINIGSFVDSVVRFVWMVINAVLILWNNVIAPLVNWLVTVLAPGVQGVVQIILGVINYVFTTISDIVGGILKFLGGILDYITGIFTGDWDLAWQGVCNIFTGIWETIVGVIKGVINSIILVINTLISGLYSTLAGVVNGIGSIFGAVASALGFDDMEFSIPNTAPQIPYLAEGGVVTEATTAVIGEGSDKEAVLPLNTGVFREIAKGIEEQRPVQSNPVQNDYSVTFSAGSIVIQLLNASEAELEKAAEKIMKIIARKQQLRAMAVRR